MAGKRSREQKERLEKARKKGRGASIVRDSKTGRFVVSKATTRAANVPRSYLGRSEFTIVRAGGKSHKRRKPRGGLLHGDDPTLAKRVEEELYGFGC